MGEAGRRRVVVEPPRRGHGPHGRHVLHVDWNPRPAQRGQPLRPVARVAEGHPPQRPRGAPRRLLAHDCRLPGHDQRHGRRAQPPHRLAHAHDGRGRLPGLVRGLDARHPPAPLPGMPLGRGPAHGRARPGLGRPRPAPRPQLRHRCWLLRLRLRRRRVHHPCLLPALLPSAPCLPRGSNVARSAPNAAGRRMPCRNRGRPSSA